jgi:hypothetical protein
MLASNPNGGCSFAIKAVTQIAVPMKTANKVLLNSNRVFVPNKG